MAEYLFLRSAGPKRSVTPFKLRFRNHLTYLIIAGHVCVYRKVNIVDTMFKMLEKYSNDLEEIVRVRTIALEEERKKTENLLSQMLPA